jgi:hypothetical protein
MAENTIHGDFSSKSYTSTTWQWIVTTKGKLIRLTRGSYPSITESLHYDPSSPGNELNKTADLLAKIAADMKETIATRVADNPHAPWPP